MTPSTLTFKLNKEGHHFRTLPNLESSKDIYKAVLDMGFDAVNSFGKRRGEMLYEGNGRICLRQVLDISVFPQEVSNMTTQKP